MLQIKHGFKTEEQRRLRQTFGCEYSDEFSLLLLECGAVSQKFAKYGILEVGWAMRLAQADFCEIEEVRYPDQADPFDVVDLPHRFQSLTADYRNRYIDAEDARPELGLGILRSPNDDYAEYFDEDGCLSEIDNVYSDLPDYSGWGHECLMMSKERLGRELQSGEWRRLVHRTIYRPLYLRKKVDRPLLDLGTLPKA